MCLAFVVFAILLRRLLADKFKPDVVLNQAQKKILQTQFFLLHRFQSDNKARNSLEALSAVNSVSIRDTSAAN